GDSFSTSSGLSKPCLDFIHGYITKYPTMKNADKKINNSLTRSGSSVYRVKKLSIRAASTNTGVIPSISLSERIALSWNACNLEYVPGKSSPLPSVNPAPPASITDDISRVPCNQIVSADSASNPRSIKKN